MSDTGAGGGGGTDTGGGGAEGGSGHDDGDGGGSGSWWHLWSDIKRWVTGGQEFEVETERAVLGVRG
jgi:hypothetical protein